ncbi:Fur family ferric uptake transcriptional regulator [Marmoricola sp. OAE513]|uniref:Fur family transcriptional regulator n=1 Tax=Marmoricola sp. OAE513 TaxID=2817894 RepID=UPI001AE695AA
MKRDMVLGVLEGSPEFLSAQDIHAALRASGQKVGLATVYRVVQALQESGAIDALRNENGELTYRSCESTGHHHHLVCRACGRTVEVQGPAVERWADSVAAEHGFAEVSHTVEVFGICGDHRS